MDMAMGRRLGRFMDLYGVPRLVSRFIQRLRKKAE